MSYDSVVLWLSGAGLPLTVKLGPKNGDPSARRLLFVPQVKQDLSVDLWRYFRIYFCNY